MKKRLLFLSVIALIALNTTSCNKDKDDPTPNNPTNPNPDPTPTAPTAPTPTVENVYGTLVSVQMTYSYSNEFVPTPMKIEMEAAVAAFPASLGSSTLVAAGNVSVNDVALDKTDDNAYYVTATPGMPGSSGPSSLSFSGGSNWSVSGSGSVSGFTYNHTGDFPDYTGDLPTTVTKSSDLTITLGSSNVSDADSVYIVVAAGNVFVHKSVAGNATSATITSAELASLPTVSDNSGLIEIVPYRITLQTIGGKQYAFIKEKAVVGNININ